MDIKANFLSIEQAQEKFFGNEKLSVKKKEELSFKDILKEKSTENSEIKFSKHASNRLVDRNISLSEEQLDKLNSAAQKASAKGIKESLVIMDSLAFIVNIPNNTVVTALDQSETGDNIFTNIDGAVII